MPGFGTPSARRFPGQSLGTPAAPGDRPSRGPSLGIFRARGPARGALLSGANRRKIFGLEPRTTGRVNSCREYCARIYARRVYLPR